MRWPGAAADIRGGQRSTPPRTRKPASPSLRAGVGLVVLSVLCQGCSVLGLGSPRSVDKFCTVVESHEQRFTSSMDDANTNGGLGGLLQGVSAIGDLKQLWTDLAKVAPTEIQTDVEATRDAWLTSEQGAVSQNATSVVANALLNGAPAGRVNTYIGENCGWQHAPFGRTG